jgi:hypothetical protein
MSKRILANVQSYFEQYTSVNFYDMLNVPTVRTCGSSPNIVSFPTLSDEPYDLYIMIKPQDDIGTSYFAAASSCDRSDVDNRPFFGIYFLNFAKMTGTEIKEFFYFSTFAHEFVHILGFSSSLYDKYVKPDGSPRPLSEVVGCKLKCLFSVYQF